jgi:hypothetical protein
MATVRLLVAGLVTSYVFGSAAFAQPPVPQPGPEHKKLKELEGTWEAIIKAGPDESKGTVVYKMELGGLWLTSEFQGDFAGMKFTGRGLDGYDPAKKKYVGVWVDSWSTAPLVMEGTYDKDGKVLTMTGEGPGPDGSPMKYKATTEHKDKDTMEWTMLMNGPDGKEAPMMSITYKRKKGAAASAPAAKK